jgi:glycine dehydrogenase subunit 2
MTEVHVSPSAPAGTVSGNRGLIVEEPLLFEQGGADGSGVDLPEPRAVSGCLAGFERTGRIGLPGLAEPQVVRHYTRLSQKNYSIDAGFYPLGSCTMKYNPRLNEKLARTPGLGDLHPMQPVSTVQGALEAIHVLAAWLMELTGMAGVAMSPAAGAHGELCGVMAIRAAQEAKGNPRKIILVPESAHGTNPATAALCGYSVVAIPATAEGRVDIAALKAKLSDDVAGLMLTNPKPAVCSKHVRKSPIWCMRGAFSIWSAPSSRLSGG